MRMYIFVIFCVLFLCLIIYLWTSRKNRAILIMALNRAFQPFLILDLYYICKLYSCMYLNLYTENKTKPNQTKFE